jgi:hypothetical protein
MYLLVALGYWLIVLIPLTLAVIVGVAHEYKSPPRPLRKFAKIALAVVWVGASIFVWTGVSALIRTYQNFMLSNSTMRLLDVIRVVR